MGIELQDLGVSQEELVKMVVDAAASKLLVVKCFDPDDEDAVQSSPLANKLRKHIEEHVNKQVGALAEVHIFPHVNKFIENLTLTETNRWGEKRGESITFTEYLVQRADAYLREEVNYEGKSKQASDSYGWKGTQTRLTHLVNKHLQYSIETAMKEAVSAVNAAIVPALEETVKLKLGEITKSIQKRIAG